jgi:hypothetical protein
MPEWLNGTVSKTVVGLVSTEGSNPSLPARDLKRNFDLGGHLQSAAYLCGRKAENNVRIFHHERGEF